MAQKADNKAMNNVSREWRNKLINVNGSQGKTKYIANCRRDKNDNMDNEEPTKQRPKQEKRQKMRKLN